MKASCFLVSYTLLSSDFCKHMNPLAPSQTFEAKESQELSHRSDVNFTNGSLQISAYQTLPGIGIFHDPDTFMCWSPSSCISHREEKHSQLSPLKLTKSFISTQLPSKHKATKVDRRFGE